MSIAKLERVVLDFAVGHARQQVEAARDQASRYHFCLMLRGQPPLPLFTHTDDGRRDVLHARAATTTARSPACPCAGRAPRCATARSCGASATSCSCRDRCLCTRRRRRRGRSACSALRRSSIGRRSIRGAARRRRERLRRHGRGREGRVARRDRRGVPEPGAARRPAGRGALAGRGRCGDGRQEWLPRRGHRRGGGARAAAARVGGAGARGAAAGRRSARLRARACGGRGAAGEAARDPRRHRVGVRRARGDERPGRRRRAAARAGDADVGAERGARARGCSTREAATLCCSRR